MDDFDFKKEGDIDGVEEVYSKVVKAGRRTYFFDVKATRNNDYYVTITESRKKQVRDNSVVYEKHKLFLYKEDFCKFGDGLNDVLSFIRNNRPDLASYVERQEETVSSTSLESLDDEFDKL